MASRSRKHPAPDTAPVVDSKRQQMSAFTSNATSLSIEFFDISVVGDPWFDVYPERLRDRIQERHEMLIRTIMARFEEGKPLTPNFEYRITKKKFSYRADADADFKARRPKRYPAVSLANQAVLQEFLDRVPPRSKITELKLVGGQEPSTNPAFAQLHSVRNGEMGWGMDRFGCLSLQLTYIQGDRLRHELVFVERTAVNPPTVDLSTANISTDNSSMVNPPTVNPPTADPPTSSLSTINASTTNTKTVDSTAVKVEDVDDDCYIVEGPNAAEGSKLKNATAVKETTTVKKDTTADKKKGTTGKEKVAADKAPTTVKKEDTADLKKTTTVEKETTADKKKPMAYKAPAVTDVTDGDDDDDCVIVGGPKSSR
jgi:hypothetical protein